MNVSLSYMKIILLNKFIFLQIIIIKKKAIITAAIKFENSSIKPENCTK